MARINPLFGRMKGKYGGSVMYSYNGKQCMRERVIEVSNPRSSRQSIQRAILATCGRFVSAFTPILNNSIQSESSKVKTLAKIRSYNMDYLRQLAAQNLGFYNRKGSVYVSPNDYIISRGDLQGINPLRSEAARLLLDSGSLAVPSSEIRPFQSYTASQAFPSVAVGDQITILATYTSDFSRATTIVRYCRFAFKDDTTPVFVFDAGGPTRLNPAAIDLSKADGDWQLLGFSDETVDDVPVSTIEFRDFVGVDRIDMAGIIVSREADKKRSSASMVSAIFDDDPDFLLEGVYPTYMDGSTNIEMPSDVYLDNDAQVTIYFARLPSSLPYAVSLVEGSRQLVKLSTNAPLDASSGLALTISREGSEATLNVLYGGAAVSSSTIRGSVQWLPNGFLALEGDTGDLSITAGTITAGDVSVRIN